MLWKKWWGLAPSSLLSQPPLHIGNFTTSTYPRPHYYLEIYESFYFAGLSYNQITGESERQIPANEEAISVICLAMIK